MKTEESIWSKIMHWGLVALAVSSLFYYFIHVKPEEDRKYNLFHSYEGSHINLCNTELSCECRDRCNERYGHSSWESWVYNDKHECWCVEKDKSERMF